jgi:hypothetical protein
LPDDTGRNTMYIMHARPSTETCNARIVPLSSPVVELTAVIICRGYAAEIGPIWGGYV